ncbi:hypothetical protein [Lyngbya sp. CCY1209]|uniref:hypothetical protein n=1 Tax=Lyngbya sp. CCY1209 TaxID=2886103 RepID=UPI002D20DAB3|nr:hypothetical protein [Lyngbya sp. CCY1209]MEB3883663.1 hypothetical protein [Lyngbya sp. CCY1209]
MSLDILSMLAETWGGTPHFHFYHLTEWVFAQQVTIDLWTNVKNTWNHLLETGQLWAFLIGLGAGWWAKSLLP